MKTTTKQGILAAILTVIILFSTAIQASAAIPAISSARYMKTYSPSGSKISVYTTSSLGTHGTYSPARKYNAVIYASDEIYVYQMAASYSYISYPTDSGRRYGYIRTSALTANNYPQDRKTSSAKITTYKRPGGAAYGYISKGDFVYTVAQSGSYTQVVYSVGALYKMGWVTTGSYNRYVNTDLNTNPGSNSSARPVPDGMYKLVSVLNSRYVWDIDSASTADGGNLQLYEDNGTNAEKFNFTCDSDGYYTIINVGSGKAVDCAGAGSADGTNICQFTPNNTSAQKWRLVPAGNGTFTLICKCNGKAIDVAGGIAANKRNIQIYQPNHSAAQQFKLVETARNHDNPAAGNISYAPYGGVSYANRGLSAARVAALDKARQMVTIQWTAPCDFPTWASSKGGYNRATATDGTSDTKFVRGKTYTGVPYSMKTNSYDDIAWTQLLRNGITTSSMTGRHSGYPVSGTDKGIDCSYFVYAAIKSAVGGRISYQTTNTMLKSTYYKKINLSSMKPGDIFLKSGHVMMYVGMSGGRYAVFEADADDSKCSYNTYSQSYINKYGCYKYVGFSD